MVTRSGLSGMTLLSLLLISLLACLGWFYCRFPHDWWNEVDPEIWLLRVIQIEFLSVISAGIVSAVFLWLPISFSYKSYPKVTQKYLILLAPLLLVVVIPLWGAYCSLQPGDAYPVLSHGPDPWYIGILEDFFLISTIYTLIVAAYVSYSRVWKGERLMAAGFLGSELAVAFASLVFASMFAARLPF